jgi:FolB domain-containing protein
VEKEMIRQLNINSYKTHIILGNNDYERYSKRPVVLNICLRFSDDDVKKDPDDLENTVCYDSLLHFIDKKLENTGFKLIEGVAKYVYDIVSEYIKIGNVLKRVEIIKPCPLGKNNLESSSFIYSDW